MKIKSSEFIKGIIGSDKILLENRQHVAFIGRSNVGKSSVINSITNTKKLAHVSSEPGKTRQINFYFINNKFYFVDLPGYGYAKLSAVEKEKLRKRILWYILDVQVQKRFFIIIIDIKVGITDFDNQIIHLMKENNYEFIILANKADKLKNNELRKRIEQINSDFKITVIPYSAKSKYGKEKLDQYLIKFLIN